MKGNIKLLCVGACVAVRKAQWQNFHCGKSVVQKFPSKVIDE